MLQLTRVTTSFRVPITLLRRTHRKTHMPAISICQEHCHRQGKDRFQTNMPKANANKTALDAANRLKPNALIPIRTAKRVKANPLQLTSHVSGTRAFRSYGNTMYQLITICTNPNLYQKKAPNFLQKNYKPFWGQHLQKMTSNILL
jgi:hypothetical protein